MFLTLTKRQGHGGRLWLLGAATFLGIWLMATSSVAGKPLKPITGTLSKRGYTVIALTDSGRARIGVVRGHRFKVRPPTRHVTLQLRDPAGSYAGPIVVGRAKRGRRVILGVAAGARLGRVKLKGANGYANVGRRLATKWTFAKRWARAKRGAPIGNGRNVGRVRVKNLRSGVPGDLDRDGVPNSLDIDDDGDLVLDSFDRSRRRGARTSQALAGPLAVSASPMLELLLEETVNANAPNLTEQQIDAALPAFGGLLMELSSFTRADPGTQVELDCGAPNTGLPYCRSNGSSGTLNPNYGPALPPGGTEGAPYPSCCDPDSNGFGALSENFPNGDPSYVTYNVGLKHHATTDEVRAGDLVVMHATMGGGRLDIPGTVQFVFETVPTVASYSDGQGNAATIEYPVDAPNLSSPSPTGGAGTRGNPLPVRVGPDGHGRVTLNFWRPQRRPFANEAGGWIDTGHNYYTASIADVGQQCLRPALSSTDPSLTPYTPPSLPSGLALLDSASDRPANSANQLSLTVDLTQCLALGGLSFNPGEEAGIQLGATPSNTDPENPGGHASTHVYFERE